MCFFGHTRNGKLIDTFPTNLGSRNMIDSKGPQNQGGGYVSFVSQEGPSILRVPKTEPQQVALDVYRVYENLIEIQRNGLGPPKSDRCFEGDIFQKATRPSIHVKSLGCRLLET